MDHKNFQKVVLTCFWATLLLVSGLVQQSTGGSSRKLASTIRNNFARQRYSLGKLSESKRGEISWFKRKRTMYKNPCPTVTNDVDTKTMIETGSTKSSFTYQPSKLTEVKCKLQGNTLNARGRPDCQTFTGDCIDLVADLEVLKFMGKSFVSTEAVQLKVGCACMIPI